MMKSRLLLCVTISCGFLFYASAQLPAPRTESALVEKFQPVRAPKAGKLWLKQGDRLAICGDSITEQKMYSRIMEDYLTMCVPELGVTVRQYGWGGERAPGFLGRMTNDVLRFDPTVATTCYGMNDHEYRVFEDRIGETYRSNSLVILQAFAAAKVRTILGSPGTVGKVPQWSKSPQASVDDLNLNLCRLRNIDIELARKNRARFADVFWPMLVAGEQGRSLYGTDYAMSGKDGVHPGWAGQTVMAYAFLRAMGLDGDLGTLTVDLKGNKMKAAKGHEVVGANGGEYQIRSSRYVFCPCLEPGKAAKPYPVCSNDDVKSDDSIRSAMSLIPFNRDLNRFTLVARKGNAASYRVTWGGQSRTFSASELAKGVNLAEAFPCNPFCEAFAKVDAAVAAKQAFETTQIKQIFHGREGKADMAAAVASTEKQREPLAQAIKEAFVPVTHTIAIAPE